jgi:GNAT superfamily N-acetyltransferase
MMSGRRGWFVKSWDRARASGVITSDELGDLTFDGSVALVDDFVAGEPVEIELDRLGGGGYRVRRIWPDDPRFVAPAQARSAAPPLRPELAAAAGAALAHADGSLDYRIVGRGADVLVQGDDDQFADNRPQVELRLRGVDYLELPARWDGKSMRLADEDERAYLATRGPVTAETIALRIVDGDRHIFFVTCAAIEATGGRDHDRAEASSGGDLPPLSIVEADLTLAAHARDVVAMTQAYALDPMGNAAALPAAVIERLVPGLRNHPTTLVFLAYAGGRPVGIATCFLGFSTFHARPLVNLHDLAVAPGHRRRGVATRLLDAVEQKARALGCCRLTLEVQENNSPARRVYARAGFSQMVYQEHAGGGLFYVKTLQD